MILIFFKKNITFVIDKLNNSADRDNYSAFWYSPGLISYSGIETIVDISKIYIEDSVAEAFKADYSYLLDRVEHEVYVSHASDNNAVSANTCVFASNDTHIYLFKSILARLDTPWRLFCRATEGAPNAAKKEGLEATAVEKIPGIENYSSLLLSNDWGPLEQNLNLDFLKAGKNTVCLQESVIDFNKRDKRMLFCSLPVFQGIVTLKNVDLRGKISAVIGNPRYEELKPMPLKETNKVLINVNFTYGIHENIRDKWVADAVNACTGSDIDYVIIQHPRDKGDFSKYNLLKTNASNVHGALADSSLLITRFSSLIHEALCLGRTVIYYNMHDEKLFYDFEPDNKCLYYARTPEELKAAISSYLENNKDASMAEYVDTYLTRHLGITRKGLASQYVKDLMDDVNTYPLIREVTSHMKIYNVLKRTKRKLFGQSM